MSRPPHWRFASIFREPKSPYNQGVWPYTWCVFLLALPPSSQMLCAEVSVLILYYSFLHWALLPFAALPAFAVSVWLQLMRILRRLLWASYRAYWFWTMDIIDRLLGGELAYKSPPLPHPSQHTTFKSTQTNSSKKSQPKNPPTYRPPHPLSVLIQTSQSA